ncbi:SfnB family sulfur acquisition oxidoreductase [Shimwellia pseudoproteus]|uniref:SfnB family sulfur acquisition oxidoreductase n=1 Tax=Shimwellia pseudoproteus TaxID=570012 RepID=UPI0018EB76FE|nr:SfnB family sulfur acquisition oxidoreductase [Shimwellia pseudoproteus]MBJ3816140.1 SfnB family sulfur acquisition oxidoreductase [Shimwellia pseudoproteus]
MTTAVHPKQQARRITSPEQALAVARELAETFRRGAAGRDSQRQLPHQELALLFQCGLGAITVPREYGGLDISNALLAQIVALLSEADSAIGQVPQNHFYALDVLRVNGSDSQQRRLFQEVLDGVHLGNALAEFSSAAAHQRYTRVHHTGEHWQLDGQKFYATGALFADRVPVAAKGNDGKEYLVFVPRHAAGLTITDDWSGFGQLTTGSGSVDLAAVVVDSDDIVPFQSAFERPTTVGPLAQLLHAAIDQGIARAAFRDMLDFLRNHARPWPDAQVTRASDDPLTLDRTGLLATRLSAGDALLELAGLAVDAARQQPDAGHVAHASIEVAKARAWTTEVSLEAANLLFELSGTRATLEQYNLSRHWRNARTHTLHDPVRWKYPVIGNYVLNGVLPARRGTL